MIKISDNTDLMPHLFELSEHFEQCTDDADVEIWPAALSDEISNVSNVFTIFVDQECDLHVADTCYKKHHELRPNNIFAVTAFNPNHDWPFSTVNFWSNVYYTLRSNPHLRPLDIDTKPRDACALFGGWEPGREQMVKQLQQHNLIDQCFVTLKPKWSDFMRFTPEQAAEKLYYQSPEIPDLDVAEFNQLAYTLQGLNTMPMFSENRYKLVSMLIPYELYNRTYLSIVSETEHFPFKDTVYLSEKIAKPLIAGHPFLVYGAPGFCKYLKSQGLKTFDKWIDETYDDMSMNSRATAVIDSFDKFAKQTQETKLQMFVEMQEVCKHNQQLVTDVKFLLSPIVKTILQRFS